MRMKKIPAPYNTEGSHKHDAEQKKSTEHSTYYITTFIYLSVVLKSEHCLLLREVDSGRKHKGNFIKQIHSLCETFKCFQLVHFFLHPFNSNLKVLKICMYMRMCVSWVYVCSSTKPLGEILTARNN